MLRLKAERRSLARESGASAAQSLTKTEAAAHRSANAHESRVLASRFLRTTLCVALGLAVLTAAIVGVGALADLVPGAVFGLCLAALAIMALIGLVRT